MLQDTYSQKLDNVHHEKQTGATSDEAGPANKLHKAIIDLSSQHASSRNAYTSAAPSTSKPAMQANVSTSETPKSGNRPSYLEMV